MTVYTLNYTFMTRASTIGVMAQGLNSETNDWRGLYYPVSMEQAENWVLSATNKPGELNLSIFSKKENLHIGFIGLRSICNRSRRAEIWVYIGNKSFWHQGFGSDAVETLVNFAFTEMNLHRIWLQCNPEFKNVVRCYEKVGFKKEGILREEYFRQGKYRDVCVMGLLKHEKSAL